MASHRKSKLMQLFVGSSTQKVLTHAHIPVMVFR
jgi:nucleotide-binding universal stress UspA family protein